MQQSPFYSFPAPAKLNLFLHIVGRLPNGYHQLETVFQFLAYSDTIDIQITRDNNITLLTPITGVANDDNLIIKAAYLLKQHQHHNDFGANIRIKKILPMGGGLGGGSSNAATVLLALNTLWKINLSSTELCKIAANLGADIPIFIHGHSAFAQGIGDKFTAATPKTYWYLVSKPSCSISTQTVFSAPDLPRNTKPIIYHDNDIEKYHNDCQTWVIKHYPEVAKLMERLVEYAPSQMTGTGACIFSRFNSQQEATKVQSQLPSGIESFIAKGVNHSPLLAAIEQLNLRHD